MWSFYCTASFFDDPIPNVSTIVNYSIVLYSIKQTDYITSKLAEYSSCPY
jgi:hypothetical protein